MDPELASPPHQEPSLPNGRRRGWLRWWPWIVVGGGALVMWAGVFAYHLSGAWQADTPGRLDDPAFAASAEELCANAGEALAGLPPAWQTTEAVDRAEVIDASADILNALVASLRSLPTATGDDQRRVDEWLGDWERFVEDRTDFARRLRDDPDTRFFVTQSERDRRQITLAIDRFAATNDMPTCATPRDLA